MSLPSLWQQVSSPHILVFLPYFIISYIYNYCIYHNLCTKYFLQHGKYKMSLLSQPEVENTWLINNNNSNNNSNVNNKVSYNNMNEWPSCFQEKCIATKVTSTGSIFFSRLLISSMRRVKTARWYIHNGPRIELLSVRWLVQWGWPWLESGCSAEAQCSIPLYFLVAIN